MTQIVSIVYKPIGQESPPDDFLRLELDEATLVVGHGIAGDARGGHHPDRDLNIMSYETLTNLRGMGFYTEPGQMGEQLVIHQLDVDNLEPGTQVQLGPEAIIEITRPRNGCARFEKIQGCSKEKAAGMMGMMARVVQGGRIAIGMPVRVLKTG